VLAVPAICMQVLLRRFVLFFLFLSLLAGAIAALHAELASRLVVFLDAIEVPSPLVAWLSSASLGSKMSEDAASLVSHLLRSGAGAELSQPSSSSSTSVSSPAPQVAAAALFHFLNLLAPLCPASSYDVVMLAASVSDAKLRAACLSDAVASMDLLFSDLLALFSRWTAAEVKKVDDASVLDEEKKRDDVHVVTSVSLLLAPFLLRPRDQSAPYVAQDQPSSVVEQLLMLNSAAIPAPQTAVKYLGL
jgi:hypothetical protein